MTDTNAITVALIDDDDDFRTATAQTLMLAGMDVRQFASAEAALRVLDAHWNGVVVSDIRMPRIDGLQLFSSLRRLDDALPVILVTGHGDIGLAVDAVQAGAYDFIAKPLDSARLIQSVMRAAEKRALVLENRRLALAVAEADAGDAMPLLGQTPVMERLRRTLRQIAAADVDVLVEGETGSGKEVVATMLHQWSHRRNGNFVALNCGALPESVIETELFGHEAGAFTGALKKRIGRIEHSSGGTLFLDEIESMPLATQVKLLRILEMREVSPLGTNALRPLDLRVIAASKIDLGEASAAGTFRQDLFYRLNVVSITIPPLRDRRDDIALLFAHFLTRAAKRFGIEVPPTTPMLRDFLLGHSWPGNVRELSHFAERYALGLDIDQPDETTPSTGLHQTLPERMAAHEAQIIGTVLAEHNGDVQASIAALGIPRKTFYDKLKRHGLDRGQFTGK